MLQGRVATACGNALGYHNDSCGGFGGNACACLKKTPPHSVRKCLHCNLIRKLARVCVDHLWFHFDLGNSERKCNFVAGSAQLQCII